MISILLRNYLSRVCKYHSVVVSDLCRLELTPSCSIQFLRLRGRVPRRSGPLDLLRAPPFPRWLRVTGVPKSCHTDHHRTRTHRPSAYCGPSVISVFSTVPMDTKLLIRTITAGRGWFQLPVSGGIVADSDSDARTRGNLDQSRRFLFTPSS